MANFKNEDKNILRSVRVTTQVYIDKVVVETRSDIGLLYPATVVFRKQAGRSQESDPMTTTLVAIQKALEALPGAVKDIEGTAGEEW